MAELDINTPSLSELLSIAKDAVSSGQIEKVSAILNDQLLEPLGQLADKGDCPVEVMFTVAALLWKSREEIKAEQWYKKILQLGPNAPACDRLGSLYQYMGRMAEALEYHRKAVDIQPGEGPFLSNLAGILFETGQSQQGVEMLQKAVEKTPENPQFHSNLLFRLHHLPELDSQAIFEQHKQWGLRHAPVSLAKTSHGNSPDPDRRLRVGYISPDLRRNSVAYFFESVLDGHNRRNVEVFGYGSVQFPDEVTGRLAGKCDHYRDINGVDDKTVARAIENDGIDILVDLAGHTGGNRLCVMAGRPAPVQVTYLGYPDTTGVEAIDYRLSDALAEPADAQNFYTEQLVFLPGGFLCYRPPDFAPSVAPLPVRRKGYITFGSFNNNCKTNPGIARLWAAILKATEDSRLLLKIKGADEPQIKQFYLNYFERFGIEPARLDIHGWKSPLEHLELYSQVDIALDTYPYNGTTTTCEALWMGVPVISLVGNNHHASRVGLSLLTRLGLEFFAADSADEYVRKACGLAANTDALAEIRSSMRARIAGCGLCHAKYFAQNLETAYREMWHRWCESCRVKTG